MTVASTNAARAAHVGSAPVLQGRMTVCQSPTPRNAMITTPSAFAITTEYPVRAQSQKYREPSIQEPSAVHMRLLKTYQGTQMASRSTADCQRCAVRHKRTRRVRRMTRGGTAISAQALPRVRMARVARVPDARASRAPAVRTNRANCSTLTSISNVTRCSVINCALDCCVSGSARNRTPPNQPAHRPSNLRPTK